MTATKKLRDLIRAFVEAHEKRPNIVKISRHDEYELLDELPDPLKSEASVKGVRGALPQFDGIPIRWDANETEVDWEGPLPFLQG